jgi:hypothetical protein
MAMKIFFANFFFIAITTATATAIKIQKNSKFCPSFFSPKT